MSVAVVKAITKRIRLRYGSTEAASSAAGVSPGVWSGYENADKPETTIPLGRLLGMSLTQDERSAFISLLEEADDEKARNILLDAVEATEATAKVMGTIRLAAEDGVITESERRNIRAQALEARAQLDDVIQAAG